MNSTRSNIPIPASKRPVHDQAQSKLLSQPGEIRTMVYEYTLTVAPDYSNRVSISHKTHGNRVRKKNGPRVFSVLALLQTRRLVHQEVAGIYYKLNHFAFARAVSSDNKAIHFTQNLSPPRAHSIQAITVDVGDMQDVGWTLLAFDKRNRPLNLKTLTLRFNKTGDLEFIMFGREKAEEAARKFDFPNKVKFEIDCRLTSQVRKQLEMVMEALIASLHVELSGLEEVKAEEKSLDGIARMSL